MNTNQINAVFELLDSDYRLVEANQQEGYQPDGDYFIGKDGILLKDKDEYGNALSYSSLESFFRTAFIGDPRVMRSESAVTIDLNQDGKTDFLVKQNDIQPLPGVESIPGGLSVLSDGASVYRGLDFLVEYKLNGVEHSRSYKADIQILGGSTRDFNESDGVAVSHYDGVPRIFACNTKGGHVKVYQRDLTTGNYKLERVDGQPGKELGQFNIEGEYIEVSGIAVDDIRGEYYVIDQGNHRINVFSVVDGRPLRAVDLTPLYPAGFNLKEAMPLGVEYYSPQGLAIESSLDSVSLYLSDNGWPKVWKLTPNGVPQPGFQFENVAGEGPNAQYTLERPESLAVFDNYLYVADEGHSVIKVFDKNTGKFISEFGKGYFSADVEGLAVAHDTLYAVDEKSGRINVFYLSSTPETPQYLLSFDLIERTENRAGPATLKSPDGLAITHDGKAVIADQGHARITVIDGIKSQ